MTTIEGWSCYLFTWSQNLTITKISTPGNEAKKLFDDAQEMLAELLTSLEGRAVIGLFPAYSTGDDVIISRMEDGKDVTCFMLRQQVFRSSQN